jgi:hypothetical protein
MAAKWARPTMAESLWTAEFRVRAPKYADERDWDWSDKARGRQVYDWYEQPFGM